MIELVSVMIAIAFGAIAFVRPKTAVALLIAFLPTYLVRLEIVGLPTTLLELSILATFAGYIASRIRSKKLKTEVKAVWSTHKAILLTSIALLVAAAITLPYVQDLSRSLGILKAYFIEPLMVLYLLLAVIKTKADAENILKAIAGSVAVVSVIAIIQYVFEVNIPEAYTYPEKRATGPYPYPAALALYITPLITLLTIYVFKAKELIKAPQVYFISAIGLGFIALFLSKAEGGIGAYAVIIGLYLLTTKYKSWIAGLGVATSIIAISFTALREYILNVLTFQNTSGQVRLALWEGTINLLKARPIKGAGLASFPETYALYKLDRHVELLLYPHNIFLNAWTELGLLGLIAFIALVVIFFIKAGKIKNNNFVVAAQFAMIALMIYGLVDVPYFKNDLAIQFFTIIALGIIVIKSTAKKEISQGKS